MTPLRPRGWSAFGETAAAALFISDPERRPETSPEALSRLYAFTPAEARMALRLLGGESVEKAAEALEITVNTTRTHVKNLFAKTGTNRHRELLRMMLAGCAQVRSH